MLPAAKGGWVEHPELFVVLGRTYGIIAHAVLKLRDARPQVVRLSIEAPSLNYAAPKPISRRQIG